MNKFILLFVMLNLFQHLSIAQNRTARAEQSRSIDSLLTLLKKDKADTNKINHLNALSRELSKTGDYEKAMQYANDALSLCDQIVNYPLSIVNSKKAIAYNTIGIIHSEKGDYDKALDFYFKGLKIFEEIGVEHPNDFGNKKGMASSYNNIGIIHHYKGNYDKALEFYFKAIKIYEEIGDKNKAVANTYNNIAIIYTNKGDYNKALEFYFNSLKINEETGDKNGMAGSYNNIGVIHSYKGDYDKTLEFYFKSLKIREETVDKKGIAESYNNIGVIHYYKGDYDKALENYFTSLKIYEEIGSKERMAMSYNNIGELYTSQKKYSEARTYLNKGLALSKAIGAKNDTKASYGHLSKLDSTLGNFKGAYEYHKLYSLYKDSIFNEESNKAMTEMSAKYESEKREAQIKLLEKDKEVSQAEQKKQKIITWSIAGGLILVILFAGFVFRSLRITQKQKRELNIKNQKIENAYTVIEAQKKHIEEKHKEITDSINYAERIQRALLASKELLDENLSDYFILFKPKDVVSGDFYWATKTVSSSEVENFVLVTADSTGHGVPGAIMSIVNIAGLKEASLQGIQSPDLLLNETRRLVIETLKNDGSPEGGKDGMDGSLLSFDFKNNVLRCASANNPVWIIRNGQLIEIKPDRFPIGKHDKDKTPFTLHKLDLQKGDVVYTMTDGYADQFGGAAGKKFKAKALQELLLSIAHEPMATQKQKLNDVFDTWKRNLEQVDDVCVIGVRI